MNKFYIESLNDKKEEESNTEVKVVTGESTTPAVETDNRGTETPTTEVKHEEPIGVPAEIPKEKAIEAVRAVRAVEESKEDK